MAVFMKRQAEIPPTTGDVYINVGPSAWVPSYSPNGGLVLYDPHYAILMTDINGGNNFIVSPSLPSSLYNTRMQVKGVKLCYLTVGATIDHVSLYLFDSTSTMINEVTDTTARSDGTCRTYYFSAPSYFLGGDQVTLEVGVLFSNRLTQNVYIRSATFILSPSVYPPILSPTGARPVPEKTGTTP
jgi:hypothetical protein